ncbi:MAG: DNA methyltransferase [Casimicrobium sp.]
MPLSWPEIRNRAVEFQRRWKGETSERAESQAFWIEFLNIFGVDRKKVGAFEKKVQLKRAKSVKNGRIDLFWPGKLLVEMKSAGADLNRAFDQATDYFDALPDRDLPRYILVCNFERFRLYDLEENIEHPEFALEQLDKRIRLFGFIAGYNVQAIKPQDPINIKAAERMGKLHDALKASGYTGHALEVLLVRLLFCLFADDTGIFTPSASFRDWVTDETKEDGSDLGRALNEFFEILNTPKDKRLDSQREKFQAFEYVNGQLFSETLRTPAFNGDTRNYLLDACALDWSTISPAIFGALFQSIMSGEDRRKLGAHYTSEENILKLIKPLFLDELRAEFERSKGNRNHLFELQKRLRTLNFLDPACGCGNFLVIAYRELRTLELDIVRASRNLYDPATQRLFETDIRKFITIDVDQFYGIEIEEFPAQIAQVALWLTDHQMNQRATDEFGPYFARIPLRSTATIRHANALRVDWNEVISAERCSYVLGNPPFVGKNFQSREQKQDALETFRPIKGSGILDFVAAWYVKAVSYLKSDSRATTCEIQCAFVSTNSITQGEQIGVLWSWLVSEGVEINFAHRTFKWSNEASGKAAVHCVIVGFSLVSTQRKVIFEYITPTSEPLAVSASNINPYLVDAPNVLLSSLTHPICRVPALRNGSKATDDGNLLLSESEAADLKLKFPITESWIKKFVGGEELINNISRYCLWLKDVSPTHLRSVQPVLERVDRVRKMREASVDEQTRKDALRPALFQKERQPQSTYLGIPRTSSELRSFVPLGYLEQAIIASDNLQTVEDATLHHFGCLSSTMHNAWIRAVCGRLESRYRYSAGIVYNNFPWPDCLTRPSTDLSAKERSCADAIEAAAQGVLNARAAHPESSLADLYDPLTMPADLLKAHQKLDATVDAAYYLSHAADGAKKTWKSDAERVAFLFTLYQKFTSLLPSDAPKKPKRAKASKL